MPRVRRTALALAATLCLTAAPLAAKAGENFDRTFELDAGGSVAVANVNGSIAIKAADGSRVVLRAVKTADNADCLETVTIAIDAAPADGKARTLRTETKHDKRSWLSWGGCNASVAYELTVPRGAAAKAASVNGEVTIENVQGDIDAETVNGAVNIRGASGAVAAKTVNGAVRAGIADAAAGKNYSFKTVNGSLRVSLPPGVSGKFRASTLNGAIKTDFPLEVRKRKHWGKKSIDAQLGDGAAGFSFSTVNGSIDILKN